MDFDKAFPGHADVAIGQDVGKMARFMVDEYAGVKNAVHGL